MDPTTFPVTVYWRPGCSSCDRLRRGLTAAGVVTHEINIWRDDHGAQAVRAVAYGSETVPTVIVGTTALVDASLADVLGAIERLDPTATFRREPSSRSTTPRSRGALEMVQWSLVIVFLFASLLAEVADRATLSWALDVLNVVTYFVVKAIGRSFATTPSE